MLNMYKTLIIKSIGTANPGIAKILADAFKINHEFLVKQLYNAPSVFLKNAEKEIADKASELLEQRGLEVFLQDANMPLPVKAEPVDIAIFIKNPLAINQVSKQLAIFLGCKENEALSLLLNEPSVVLGNVSMATAETLQKRIDAEVIASNPRKDFYTIQFLNGDKKLPQEIQALLKTKGIQAKSEKTITNIPYLVAQEIWQRYQLSKKIILYNQSYQRFEIVLQNFDLNDTVQTAFLTDEIGMPKDALSTIFENLPVVLDESINQNEANEKMEIYSNIGLVCKPSPIPFGKYKINAENIANAKQFEGIVKQFYKDIKLEKDLNRWSAPLPLDSVLNRFLEKQLEFIGCEITREYEAL